MKSEEEVRTRLKKLRSRYRNRYAKESQERRHSNCLFNLAMDPLERAPSVITEFDLTPRKVSNLIVFQPDAKVHFCMYGSENAEKWNGDLCDSDETARGCKLFTPRTSAEDKLAEFDKLMEDDKYVYDTYGDVAALQWVLEDRVHSMSLSFWDRVSAFFTVIFTIFVRRRVEELPAIPDDMWEDKD